VTSKSGPQFLGKPTLIALTRTSPMSQAQKNDFRDAEAIAEAVADHLLAKTTRLSLRLIYSPCVANLSAAAISASNL